MATLSEAHWVGGTILCFGETHVFRVTVAGQAFVACVMAWAEETQNISVRLRSLRSLLSGISTSVICLSKACAMFLGKTFSIM